MITNFKKVEISQDIINWSQNKAHLDQESLKKQGSKLHSRFNLDWILDNIQGNIGECLFNEFLLKNKIEHIWDNKNIGKADDTDFIIKNKKFDVKTILRKYSLESIKDNYYPMINKRQFFEHPQDYYVFVLLKGNGVLEIKEAYILGFINKKYIDTSKTNKNLIEEAIIIDWEQLIPIDKIEMIL